jgi:hypothetical protein
MDMRMMLQFLVPSVQDHCRRRLLAILLPKRLIERTPGRSKQQIVKLSPIAKNQRRKRFWNREDDLKVRHVGQEQARRLINPA